MYMYIELLITHISVYISFLLSAPPSPVQPTTSLVFSMAPRDDVIVNISLPVSEHNLHGTTLRCHKDIQHIHTFAVPKTY